MWLVQRALRGVSILAFFVVLCVTPAWGVGTAQIEAVVLQQGYSTGFGGAITLTYRPAVLFSDGTYTGNAARALEGSAPIDGRWKRTDSGWTLNPANGKAVEVAAKMLARPAQPNATLEGEYRSLSGVGATNANAPVVAAWKNLQFARDGSLRAAQGAGASAGSVATASSKTEAATYRLDGYRITITQADGRSETRLFYFFPDSDRAIGLGDSTLSKRR